MKKYWTAKWFNPNSFTKKRLIVTYISEIKINITYRLHLRYSTVPNKGGAK